MSEKSTANTALPIASSVAPVEFALAEQAVVIRGYRWIGDANWAILVHDTGQDLDAWGDFPAELASMGYSVLAFDLPGHGLSDGEWSPLLLSQAVTAAIRYANASGARRRFIVAAGTAVACLDTVPGDIDGLIAISPTVPDPAAGDRPPSAEPKLVLVGGREPSAQTSADRFFRRCRGWVVLSSFGTTDNGTALLHGDWGRQAREQIHAFLADYRLDHG